MGKGNPHPIPHFKKGQSGNPKGAPKKEWTFRSLLLESLEEKDEKGTPYKKVITKKLASLAARGDIVAIKEVGNRIDGLPVATQQIVGADGGSVQIENKLSPAQEKAIAAGIADVIKQQFK